MRLPNSNLLMQRCLISIFAWASRQALSNIARNIFEDVQEKSANVKISKAEVKKSLYPLKSEFGYPMVDKVDSTIAQKLRDNGKSRSDYTIGSNGLVIVSTSRPVSYKTSGQKSAPFGQQIV